MGKYKDKKCELYETYLQTLLKFNINIFNKNDNMDNFNVHCYLK